MISLKSSRFEVTPLCHDAEMGDNNMVSLLHARKAFIGVDSTRRLSALFLVL